MIGKYTRVDEDRKKTTLLCTNNWIRLFYCRQATPLTIFAPTDAAFAKLPQSVLDQLSTDPQALADTLKFHVTSGIVISPMIQDGSEFTSLSGKNLTAHRYANQVEI